MEEDSRAPSPTAPRDGEDTQGSASSFRETLSQSLGLVRPSSPVGFLPSAGLDSDDAQGQQQQQTSPSRRVAMMSSDLALPTSPFVPSRTTRIQRPLETRLAYPSSDAPSQSRFSDLPRSTGPALTSQQSLLNDGTLRSSTARHRRGDIAASRALESFILNSQGEGNNTLATSQSLGLPLSSQAGLEGQQGQQASTHLTSDPTAVKRVIWGTNVDVQESMNMFKDFIVGFTKGHLVTYLQEMGKEDTGDSMEVSDSSSLFYDHYLRELMTHGVMEMNLDCTNLKAYEPSRKLYQQLIRYPQEIIPLLDHTLTELVLDKYAADSSSFTENDMMKVRPFNLDRNVNLRELDPSDIDQLVTVKGLLIRASPIIPDLKTAFFRCSVCEQTVTVENDRGRIREPTICPREACKNKNTLALVHNRCEFSNKQVYRLQETPDEIPDGQTPYTVSMCVFDDLVDVAKPGDRVEVTGIFRGVPVRENSRRRAIKALFKTYVDIVHIKRVDKKRIGIDSSIRGQEEAVMDFVENDKIVSEDPEEDEKIIEVSRRDNLYELLARSIAPSIFGMEDVKKGILLQLFGGTNKFNKNKPGSPKIRGEVNILLVGDPGVSKSQLLQYVHKLTPRGVYTSGKGSSAVGLTAYVTRDPDTRQLVLESGALVLSDGGICCIDEFDKMTDYTRSVLHEVMEQQTISVAKAGIITTLNARTSILACANPINSKFDTSLSVAMNVNLPPPLMSRFDLLYLILDKPNERDDRKLAQHLVSLFLTERPTVNLVEDFVSIELFTKYINYAKNKVHPVITEEAGEALASYYVNMRKSGSAGGFNVVTFTTRQLESMIRLSEAHAKMRLSDRVEVSDVNEANRLIMTALQTAAMDPRTGKIDLDLITTGISTSSRLVREQKRGALRDLLQSLERTTLRWAEVNRLFQEQSDQRISDSDFNGMLQDLCDEGYVHLTGRTNAEKMIRKTK